MANEAQIAEFIHAFTDQKNFGVKVSESSAECLVVSLEGYLGGEAATALMEPLIALIEACGSVSQIVVDLARLEYITSLGIGTLTMMAATARKQNIDVFLRDPQPSVRNVLELLGILAYFPIEDPNG